MTIGTSEQADAYHSNAFGLTIENTADGIGTANIRITTDKGNETLLAGGGTIIVTIGTGGAGTSAKVIFTRTGGTLAILDTTGNLRIAGTLGTGQSF